MSAMDSAFFTGTSSKTKLINQLEQKKPGTTFFADIKGALTSGVKVSGSTCILYTMILSIYLIYTTSYDTTIR